MTVCVSIETKTMTLFEVLSYGLSSLSMQRVIVIGVILIIYTIVNAVIKYVMTAFVVFCVLYTVQDLYKHRKRYLWFFNGVYGSLILLVQYGLGDEYLKYIVPIKKKKNMKKI